MKISILVEGETEKAFEGKLREFLERYLGQKMPKIKFITEQGRIPKERKLKRVVENLIENDGYDVVIALTDLYTGTDDFQDAEDAKRKMNDWVENNPNFYPHVAAHDFEAWLIPYWETIKKRAKSNRNPPLGSPERINHAKPPSYWLKAVFEAGGRTKSYSKTIDGPAILKKNDLMVAIQACPELRAFVNRILELCGAEPIRLSEESSTAAFEPAPLHHIILAPDGEQEKIDQIRRLFQNEGVDPNLISAGRTALHLAVQANLPQVVELLLRRGADVTCITEDTQESALAIAQEQGLTQIAQLLKQYGAS